MTAKLAECACGSQKPLEISQDPMTGTVTINGTRFSCEIFDYLGQNEKGIGETIRIERKADGIVCLRCFPICPKCGLDLSSAIIE